MHAQWRAGHLRDGDLRDLWYFRCCHGEQHVVQVR